MRVLVIGQGAREHAIVRSLNNDPNVTKVFAAPANAGIAIEAIALNFSATDVSAAITAAKENLIDLVVIGPEVALAAGMADEFAKNKIACFGPTKAAATIETSKAFAKEVMKIKNIPTARSFQCSQIKDVKAALDEFGPPYVIKDDQLAAGKGVVVTSDLAEALNHATLCLEKINGKVVIEEFLEGKEVSILFISDGLDVIPLSPAQDYKRAFDKDLGPNTGGMGAYSPVDWINEELIEEVKTNIAQPVIDHLQEVNSTFVGVLYVGLIITNQGPKVIEFNARFGDPETQVILARLQTPISEIFLNAVNQNLKNQTKLIWSKQSAVTVIRAAAGYPENPQTGDEISLPINSSDGYILHAGTKLTGEKLVSNGGRVLSVVGIGDDLAAARERAYQLNSQIVYKNSHFRTDIADMER